MTVSTEGAEKASLEKQETKAKTNKRLAQLSLAALGVVFGDIATSPIYAIRECFHGEYGIAVSQANVLGILSLMFWALVMICTIALVLGFQSSSKLAAAYGVAVTSTMLITTTLFFIVARQR
jgi:K+ transporter